MPNNHASFLRELFGEGGEEHRRVFRTVREKADAKRTNMERMADLLTAKAGSSGFLILNALVFLAWILVNTGVVKLIPIFDPFPFNLLTMVVSLEAIILAVFVLITQNRTAKVDELREETHLQLNLVSEKEITKLIKMMALLLERQGIDLSKDPELHKMLRPVSEEEIEKRLEKEIL